jgi:hypothetical protein
MNSFFDNLDHHAAVKELASRRIHQLDAAEKEKRERLREKAMELAEEKMHASIMDTPKQFDDEKNDKKAERPVSTSAPALESQKKQSTEKNADSAPRVAEDHIETQPRQDSATPSVKMPVQAREKETSSTTKVAANQEHKEQDQHPPPATTKMAAKDHEENVPKLAPPAVIKQADVSSSLTSNSKAAEQSKYDETYAAKKYADEKMKEMTDKGMSAKALRADEEAYFDKLQKTAQQQAEIHEKKTETHAKLVLTAEQARHRAEQYFDHQLHSAENTGKAHLKMEKESNLHMTSAQASADLRTYFEKEERKTRPSGHAEGDKIMLAHEDEHKMSEEQAQKDLEDYFSAQTNLAEYEEAKVHDKAMQMEEKEQHASKSTKSQKQDGSVQQEAIQAEPSHTEVESNIRKVQAEHAVVTPEKSTLPQKQVEVAHASHGKSLDKSEGTKTEHAEKSVQEAAEKRAKEEIEGIREAMHIKDAMTGKEDRADLNKYYSKLVESAKRRKEQDMLRSHALK